MLERGYEKIILSQLGLYRKNENNKPSSISYHISSPDLGKGWSIHSDSFINGRNSDIFSYYFVRHRYRCPDDTLG